MTTAQDVRKRTEEVCTCGHHPDAHAHETGQCVLCWCDRFIAERANAD
jgi:hypothetical protein